MRIQALTRIQPYSTRYLPLLRESLYRSMDSDLKCNRLNCRKNLVDKAVVVRKEN